MCNTIHENSETLPVPKILLPRDIGTDYTFKRKIVWFNAIGFLILHVCALYGVYIIFYCSVWTLIWAVFVAFVSSEGVTMGAHRLYSHRAMKATLLVRFALILLQTMAGQNCMYIWVRDHRLHHKYSDTDADPHNANRGFFFSHVGWLMSKKHPMVIQKGKTIDMSDLEADKIVMFQREWYKLLYMIFALAIPIGVPVGLWDESYHNSLFVSYFARYMFQLNITWLINSAAHLYGMKPYNKFINPVEIPLMSFLALGESFHNYHHAFPSDYRAAESGLRYSITTLLIDILAHFGLIYDLKEATKNSITSSIKKMGDGTWHT